jgi:site-specific recombinase XerD
VTSIGATALGLDRSYSAHSMRATFITTALENGAQLDDVQKAAGHRDLSTTKLYDRGRYNAAKAASSPRRIRRGLGLPGNGDAGD